MKRPDRPRVIGALAPHAKGFGIELSRQGYSPWTAAEHMYLMADVSRWLDHRGLEPAELNSVRIEAFLTDRVPWPGSLDDSASSRSHARLPAELEHRSRTNRAPPASAVGRLLLEFVGYLTNERGLAAGSIGCSERISLSDRLDSRKMSPGHGSLTHE